MTPRTASGAPPTLVTVESGSRDALHQQIYASLRAAILEGRLAPGSRVAAARALSLDLGVSRNTVVTALAQLRAEGYVEARERSGTFVAAALPEAALAAARIRRSAGQVGSHAPGLSRHGARLSAIGEGSSVESPGRILSARPRAFRTGVPALDAFPWTAWTRLTSKHLRTGMRSLGDYGPAAGLPALRTAIAAHVAAARGTACEPEQVIVTNGAQQALDLTSRLLLDAGDAVWMEEPGYARARACFAAAGARVVPVPVDDDGISVEEGMRRAPDARLAYVTPSHQYPTGVVTSAARRLALLRWARAARAWVIEDDYDSAYRYASRPLASLHGLDVDGRVLYVGTFSKTLFPALRLGYVVVPKALVDAFTAVRTIMDRQSPSVDQAVLAEFIEDGHYARHLRRMRMLYLERRDALLDAAPALFGDRLELTPGDAGMHVVGLLPPGIDDRAISDRALARGVEVPALSRHAAEPVARGGLMLGYAAFSPRSIRAALKILATTLDG